MNKIFFRLRNFLLVILIFSLGGCYVPLVKKEITVPLIEKSPEKAFDIAFENFNKDKTVEVDAEYAMEINLGDDKLSFLSDDARNKVVAFVNKYSPRVLGIDSETPEFGIMPIPAPAIPKKVKVGFRVKGKTELENQLVKKGTYNVNMSYAVEGVNMEANFDFRIDEKALYLRLNVAPDALNAMFVQAEFEIKDTWFKVDFEEFKKMQEKMGILASDSGIKLDEEALKDINNKYLNLAQEYRVLDLKERKKDEKINDSKSYHYSYEINKLKLEKLVFKFLDIYSEEMEKVVPLSYELEEKDAFFDSFIESIKDNSIDVYIDKKDLEISRIAFDINLDLSNTVLSEELTQDVLVRFTGNANYKNIDGPLEIEIPESFVSVIDLINDSLKSAEANARNARRVSDVKQLSTMVELYAMDNDDKYPAELKELEDFDRFKSPEYPEDSICPKDFGYQYKVNDDKTEYEIKFCLEKGGMGSYMSEGENRIMTGGVIATDVKKIDRDNDGLSDDEEIMIYLTNPLIADTDGDGYKDGDEVKNGYNPNGSGGLQ